MTDGPPTPPAMPQQTSRRTANQFPRIPPTPGARHDRITRESRGGRCDHAARPALSSRTPRRHRAAGSKVVGAGADRAGRLGRGESPTVEGCGCTRSRRGRCSCHGISQHWVIPAGPYLHSRRGWLAGSHHGVSCGSVGGDSLFRLGPQCPYCGYDSLRFRRTGGKVQLVDNVRRVRRGLAGPW